MLSIQEGKYLKILLMHSFSLVDLSSFLPNISVFAVSAFSSTTGALTAILLNTRSLYVFALRISVISERN